MESNVSASSFISSGGSVSAMRSRRLRSATRRAVAVIWCSRRNARSAISQPTPTATTANPPSAMPPRVSIELSVSARNFSSRAAASRAASSRVTSPRSTPPRSTGPRSYRFGPWPAGWPQRWPSAPWPGSTPPSGPPGSPPPRRWLPRDVTQVPGSPKPPARWWTPWSPRPARPPRDRLPRPAAGQAAPGRCRAGGPAGAADPRRRPRGPRPPARDRAGGRLVVRRPARSPSSAAASSARPGWPAGRRPAGAACQRRP